MGEPFALRYRPRSFDDLVGQVSVQVILREMVKRDAVPHALLFDGVRGSGKTTSARILAASLNCDADVVPCSTCPSCKSIFDGSSLDVQEVDAASNGLVSDIRALVEQVLYSTGGRNRVVLLDECHSMSREAMNALLKTLEEPPPSTVFVLLTTEPSKILDTIVSRCMKFTFRRISVADIVGRLEWICAQEGLTVDADLIMAIAERADGGMRDAVMTLDQVARVGVSTADQFNTLLGESDFAPELVTAMVAGDKPRTFELLDAQLLMTGDANAVTNGIVKCLRDVVVLKSGGTIVRQGAALDARRLLAARVDAEKVYAAMRVLWQLKVAIRGGDDPRACMTLAAVLVGEALSGRTGQAPRTATPATSGGPRLSLEDMRRMAGG